MAYRTVGRLNPQVGVMFSSPLATPLLAVFFLPDSSDNRRTLVGMNVNERALEFVCPVCGAPPREECHRLDGHTMCEPHSDRRNLVLGIKRRSRREDVQQPLERVTSERKSA